MWSSVGIVVGITIGLGIFRSPAGIAQLVPSPQLMPGLWAGGGVVTSCGALSLADLAAALPETGGLCAHLREGWGRLAGFLFGWAELVLIRASALGGIAIAFVGGKVKDPHKNLPRAIVLGTFAIIAIYVLTHAAYLYIIPIAAIGRSPLVAADAMVALFGRTGVVLVSSWRRCS